MSSWHTYPKIYALGHGAIVELFYDDVIVQEKVDGSQFTFGIFNGEVRVRSKGKEISLDNPEKMFNKAIATVLALKDKLVDGYSYRAEYLQSPHHNVLTYDREPVNNLILFDINFGEEQYLPYVEVVKEGQRLGLEVVPLLYEGKISSSADIEKLLETTSVLGGQKIEEFVVKNYNRYGRDKKALMGKYVSESFKEKHTKEWGENNPTGHDIIDRLVAQYRTSARWDKAIIHLKELGQLENSPKDIGKIIAEVPKDLLSECEEEIKQYLFDLKIICCGDFKLYGITDGTPPKQCHPSKTVEDQCMCDDCFIDNEKFLIPKNCYTRAKIFCNTLNLFNAVKRF